MIGKIRKGSGFKGCVDYVLGKQQAVLLHADGVLAESRQDIVRSFLAQASMNPRLGKPVGHIALSYSAADAPRLTDEKMVQLAQEYMREMKITDTQYIIVRHQDREHPHVHIVFNRVGNDGKTISDRNDMYRNELVCKKLKAKHGLYFAKGKERVKQHRLKEPDKSKYEIYTAVKNEIGKSRAAGGKGNHHPIQMQRADGRGAGHILHQRRIHIQGFRDRPQLQLLQAGQAFRRCRAGCRRKFQADNRRAPP